uniref:ATP synthase F0 subunit 6 n=1 Tax=Syphacia muris TaxID=451379 RepID=A0A347YCC9_9BILA|nr:ATP synthase F0 subunit 6 [Syphacia muris]
MLFLYFFWILFWLYFCEFMWVILPSSYYCLWMVFFNKICDFFGFSFSMVLSGWVSMSYFTMVLLMCFTGYFSWGLGLCRSPEFLIVWGVVAWLASTYGCWCTDGVIVMLELQGVYYLDMVFSIWSKVISILVRPISLVLRLLVNLTIGHVLMFSIVMYVDMKFLSDGVWDFWLGLFLMQMVLLMVVMYEFFVFFLQSFIFSRLLSVYLEEC